MPPTGEPDGVPNARDAQPARKVTESSLEVQIRPSGTGAESGTTLRPACSLETNKAADDRPGSGFRRG